MFRGLIGSDLHGDLIDNHLHNRIVHPEKNYLLLFFPFSISCTIRPIAGKKNNIKNPKHKTATPHSDSPIYLIKGFIHITARLNNTTAPTKIKQSSSPLE